MKNNQNPSKAPHKYELQQVEWVWLTRFLVIVEHFSQSGAQSAASTGLALQLREPHFGMEG